MEQPDSESPRLPEAPEVPRARGTLAAEYSIYVSAAESLGWDILTFDEWLAR